MAVPGTSRSQSKQNSRISSRLSWVGGTTVIVIGGDVAEAGEPLLAGIREVVYRRSLPLATGRLHIGASQLGDNAGVTGAAVMVLEQILAPAAIDAQLT